MRLRPTLAALAVLALASPLLPSAQAVAPEGTGTDSLVPVVNLPHKNKAASAKSAGTDIEFATIKGVKYALAGSYDNGLQIVDVSDPTRPRTAAVYDCGISQGDVQVFTRQVAGETRTFAGYTWDDGYSSRSSKCLTEAKRFNSGKTVTEGTFIADVTDVGGPGTLTGKTPTVSYVPFAKGSHNHSIHPSGNFLYNSNSDLITSVPGTAIEIYDISSFAAPKRLPDFPLPPVPTSLGSESHDIVFSADGKRAYSAALSQTAIIDTEDPAKPTLVTTIVDPTINVVHQATPLHMTDPLVGERDFLLIEDEFAGATGTGQCPNGGVHVYDVTGELEAAPVKVGYWNIDEVRATTATLGTCTAHVFQVNPGAKTMTIAYYDGGVRVVDLSGLVGVALGGNGVGMKEVGFRRFDDSDTWAVKTNEVAADGSFYLFGNDQNRGLDVYRFDPTKVGAATSPGVWMGAAEAATKLLARTRIDLTGYRMKCLPGKVFAPAADALASLHH
ncbi:MAG: putative secreted protein [Frankiales bacterium]|nr:putative secreted protein [Frankiales bacterium]